MTSSSPQAATQPTFRDLGVSDAALRALDARGYVHPTKVQELVLPDILDGADVLARAPTGSGKTLGFMIPLLDCIDANSRARPAALVLAPTRELAAQIVEESRDIAHARALRIAAVYGGVGIQRQAREAAKAHVLVATPGRLEDLIGRGDVALGDVEILVLDEADRMLDMGFKPAIDRIVRQTPDDRQTLFFSATLDGNAGRAARDYTVDPVTHEHAPPQRPLTEMDHRFLDTGGADKLDALLDVLDDDRDLAIVFVRTKHGADRLARKLDRADVPAVAMHGGRTQGQRQRALAAFERGEVDVLVATDVAARGIDIDRITHVVNFDIPEDSETYVHRVGRTGRAGRSGIATTLVQSDQRGAVAAIARDLDLTKPYAAAGFDPSARDGGGTPKRGGGGGGRGHGGGRQHGAREQQGSGRGHGGAREHGGERRGGPSRRGGGRRPEAGGAPGGRRSGQGGRGQATGRRGRTGS